MRLATFNINGRSPGENRVDLDRLANSIRTLAPDILALQEVDLSLPRSHDADLAAIVAEAMQCVDHRFVAALAGTPGAGWVEVGDGTNHGPGVWQRPVLPVPRPQLVLGCLGPARTSPSRFPGPGRVAVIGEEPRVALIADIETPHGVVRVASTHLSFLPGPISFS